jgi:putative ABC transport system permease protein
LIGTGLMVNSFSRIRSAELGFDPDGLLLMTYSLPQTSFPTARSRFEHGREVVEHLRQQPGFGAVATIESPQLAAFAPPRAVTKTGPRGAGLWGVSSGYVETVGLRLVEGRDFTEAEARAQAPVVIVSESIARAFWPGQSALGRKLDVSNVQPLTVIGVVRDIRPGYASAVQASAYRPMPADDIRIVSIIARVSGDATSLAAVMRTEAQRLAPGAVIPRPQPLTDALARDVADNTFQTGLFAVFGLLGLLVCVIGVYGVTGYSVGGRTREMGIRLALGARPEQLKRLIVAQSAIPLVVGLLFGLGGAWVLARQLESLLYEVRARDAVTYAAVVGVLLIAGLVAAYLPARRAGRVDPIIALRTE